MTEENKNMSIWGKVCKTDSEFTKKVNQRGGYTAIDATYQAMKATELFGAYGAGWGLKSVSYDFSLFEQTKMAVCHAVFFYIIDGKESSFPISNAINVMQGTKPDEDFCKKLETNTISKSLSRLGFSADVFLGLFDDSEYIAALKVEEAISKAEDRDAEIAARRLETTEYVTRNKEAIEAAKTASETKGLTKVAVLHLSRQKSIQSITDICERGIAAISKASELKLEELAK